MITVTHAHIITFNEERLIWHYLHHHLTFCQKVYVYDNHSTDNTVDIARSFGSRVLVSSFGGKDLNDQDYLEVKNNSWKVSRGFADYVIVGDCDEFINCKNIASELLRLKSKKVTIPQLGWYDMVSDDSPKIGSSILSINTGVQNMGAKNLIFNPELSEINYGFGCHDCKPIGKVTKEKSSINVLHYKFLGGANALNERHQMYMNRLSNLNKQRNLGSHYAWDAHSNNIFYQNLKNNAKLVL